MSPGKLPVYLRISLNGTRSEMSMGRSCEPEKWSNISGRRMGTKVDTKEFNAYLDTVQSKVYQVYRTLLINMIINRHVHWNRIIDLCSQS